MQRAGGTIAATAEAVADSFVILEITAAQRAPGERQQPIDVDARREHG